MKKSNLYIYFLALISLISIQQLHASKLVEVKVVDKDYIMLHFLDGEVTFDESLVSIGCQNHPLCHDPEVDNLISYGNALSLTQATGTSNYSITSIDDPNYSSVDNPDNCYRKSKLNGMEEDVWVGYPTNDYTYYHTKEHFIYLKLPNSMVQDRTYTIVLNSGINSDLTEVTFTYNIFECNTEAIHVNLNGYMPLSQIKSADLYIYIGDGGSRDYSGFNGNKVYIYNVDTKVSQEVGTVEFWHSSANDSWNWNLTKSNVYIANFTNFTTEGKYRLAIEGVGCSQDFEIRRDIYYEPYRVSTLGYFYMRVGEEPLGGDAPIPRQPLMIPGSDPSGFKIILNELNPFHPDWVSVSGDMWDFRNNEEAIWHNHAISGSENNNAIGGHSDAADWDRHLGHVPNIYYNLLPDFVLKKAGCLQKQKPQWHYPYTCQLILYFRKSANNLPP